MREYDAVAGLLDEASVAVRIVEYGITHHYMRIVVGDTHIACHGCISFEGALDGAHQYRMRATLEAHHALGEIVHLLGNDGELHIKCSRVQITTAPDAAVETIETMPFDRVMFEKARSLLTAAPTNIWVNQYTSTHSFMRLSTGPGMRGPFIACFGCESFTGELRSSRPYEMRVELETREQMVSILGNNGELQIRCASIAPASPPHVLLP